MTGRTLGHYEIHERLGAGGMGEVFRARDTRLNRNVAVKVLRADKVTDPHRKRRFIQEAQAASALNHPNIVVIHDINQQDGADYMVMEFIAGKTVDALIPRTGMRLGEALKLAVPIADGLAKAHAAGIIHRDIKPSNIMVSSDGIVKILDFGLAKLTEKAQPGEQDSTQTLHDSTEDGAIIGTIAYMSPEQAEGRKVDSRTDIFSFGALLYEMVTGKRAFSGGTTAATLSSVLKDEPVIPTDLPSEIDRILRRCLRKDPARRFQHMDDLRVALEELREESESGRLGASALPARPHVSRWPLWAGVAALALIAAGVAAWRGRPTTEPPAEYRMRALTTGEGLATTPDISPDGKFVAYASDRGTGGNLDLWVQPMTAGSRPIRLTRDAADDKDPVFSPDGGQIAFWSQRDGGGIYLIPALGGEERLIVRGGYQPAFSPDGKSIAYSTSANRLYESRVFVVPITGGSPRAAGADIGWAASPTWSPDGAWLLVRGAKGANQDQDFWVTPVAGGPSRPLSVAAYLRDRKLFLPFAPKWTSRGLLFSAGSAARILEIDPDTGKVGAITALATIEGFGPSGRPDQFVYVSGTYSYRLYSVAMDSNTARLTGKLEPVPASEGRQSIPSLSADGRYLAYLQEGPSGEEVRVVDYQTQKERVLTSGWWRPRLSPDGARVALSGLTGRNIHVIDTAGGQATALAESSGMAQIHGWTADSKHIIYWDATPIRFSLLDPATRKTRVLFSHPTLNIHNVEPSPDGNWLAFKLPDRGNSVLITPVRNGQASPESEWIPVVQPPEQGSRPWWSADGNLLYFLSDRDRFYCIWAQRLDPTTKRPKGDAIPLLHFHETRRHTMAGATPFGPAWTKDRLVFALREESANIRLAERVRPD